jgi:hypothetical protein
LTATTDTAERPARAKAYPTLAAFMADLSDEKREEYRREIRERLGFDPAWHAGRGVGLADATRLAGVLIGTGTQWRRRTLRGKLRKPFPDPMPNSPQGKPLYDPMQVCGWLDWTKRWPPGTAARPEARAEAA